MLSSDVIQQFYRKWQELQNRDEGEDIRKIICIDGNTINEKEMFCNQYESGRVSGIGVAFFPIKNSIKI